MQQYYVMYSDVKQFITFMVKPYYISGYSIYYI